MTPGFKHFTVITRVLFSNDGRVTNTDPPVIDNIRNGRAKNMRSWQMRTGKGKLVIKVFSLRNCLVPENESICSCFKPPIIF